MSVVFIGLLNGNHFCLRNAKFLFSLLHSLLSVGASLEGDAFAGIVSNGLWQVNVLKALSHLPLEVAIPIFVVRLVDGLHCLDGVCPIEVLNLLEGAVDKTLSKEQSQSELA